MSNNKNLKVAALIDLPRSPQSGGHVKCWERIAAAAADSNLPLSLTVYFSGEEKIEVLGDKAKIRQLPPVFSTKRLKFILPYVPDHTDLAPYHFRLGEELKSFDVIHTTDGFFAFAKTAEKVNKKYGVPLVTSFHTDTPSYARIFTRQTIEKLLGTGFLGKFLAEKINLPEQQGQKMENRLKKHLLSCSAALVTREEDKQLAESLLGKNRVHYLRLGIDKKMFGVHRHDRQGILFDYNIPSDRFIILFVGRLDVGKNVYTLVEAMKNLLSEGLPLHLITAGVGPAMEDIKSLLGEHASVPGFIEPEELARLYASVDCLALASEVEIRSMAGVEAISSGCPVLVSKKSGVAKLFNNTSAMLEVESGIPAWTEAIRKVVVNPALVESMRSAAVEYSKKNIASWHDVLKEDLFAVWEKAASAKNS